MKFNNLYEMYMLEVNDKYITLYRGLSKKNDPKHDLSSTDAPSGYSTWTDNPELARKYAGNEGYVYKINLPKAEMKDTYIDDDGERALFYNNEKPAGLDGVSGNEYLIYHDHELFDPSDIKLHANPIGEAIDNYKGEHESPDKDNGKPMHNLDGIYPDDIYTSNGAKYYGDRGGDSIDNESVNIIKNARNKPNTKVKIYRAIPDINKDINDKITSLESLINYFNKHNFFPMNNKLVDNYSKKYYDEETGYTIPYNDAQKKILEDIKKDIESLKTKLQDKIQINSGDWVTISKQYAIEHGKDNLNNKYKILSKTVPASTLYTDGNSIHEWGYNE